MTDYNDGKWHGWNGGKCPVEPQSIMEVHYINALGGYGYDKDRKAGEHSWALSCLFRVTKPAPPKPREWWIVGRCEAWFDREEAEANCPAGASIIHVREVTD